MRRVFALAILLLATPALATVEDWPALFDVTGVAADDVLNIRAAPSASAAIVGTIAHDAEGIEVVRPDDAEGWGMVNTAEGSGWVSLAYLERQPGQWDGSFPEIAICYGTEPFWGLERDAGGFLLSNPSTEDIVMTEAWRTADSMRRDRFGFGSEGAGVEITAVLSKAECSDGMSDRLYGLAIDMIVKTASGHSQLSGCCTLAGR